MTLTWYLRAFHELTLDQLYAIIALRERVFVVEQHCAFLECDGHDQASRHLWAERDGAIVAYLRVVPAGTRFAELSIGRVITAPEARGTGLGRELMRRGIEVAGAGPIKIGAQAHLEKFYGELGFQRVSDNYDEDGIPHVYMIRS